MFSLDSDGRTIRQIDWRAVLGIGRCSFGRLVRITTKVRLCQTGVVNIPPEACLIRSKHDKGVLILSGNLPNRFGHNKPAALSASVCYKQPYCGIDGDNDSF